MLRESIRKLLTHPEQVTRRDLWSALTADERTRAIVLAIRSTNPPHERLLKRATKFLKWRPQALRDRIHELAPKLDLSGVLEGFEAVLLFSLWSHNGIWPLFSALYTETCADPKGGEQIHLNFSKIEPLIQHATKIDTNLALVFLLDFALVCEQWRDILHSWLRSVDDQTILSMKEPLFISADAHAHETNALDRVVAGGLSHEQRRLDELADQLERLSAKFDDLASWMDTVSRELRELRTPPPSDLARGIDALVKEFDHLRTAVVEERDRLGRNDASFADLPSLVRISSLLTSWRSEADDNTARRVLIEQARLVLSQVALLKSTHSSVDSALLACRAEATALLGLIDNDSAQQEDTIHDLAANRHPFALLIARATQAELSVDEDIALDTWLRSKFGAALAIAVLSGRIILDPKFHLTVVDSSDDEPKLVSEGSPEEIVDQVQADPPYTSLGEGFTSSRTVQNEVEREEADEGVGEGQAEAPGPQHDLTHGSQLEGKTVQHPDDNPAVSVDAAEQRHTDSPTIDRELGEDPEALSPAGRAVWELLRSEKAAIAYHIARVEDRAPIPPPVLKALVLGREIRTGLGEIAQALREPFEWIGNDYLAQDTGGDRAIHLLVAAAALRPALIAPITGGAAVLRQLHLEGDLYLLVQTVASYGERLNGLDPAALGGALSFAQWQEEQNRLQDDVEHYLEQAGLRTILYARATEVLRIWTREDGLIRKLLVPILTDDSEALTDAVEQIQTVNFEREVARTDKMLRSGRREPIQARALESLRNYFNEAVGFLWRWQELQALRPKSDHYQQSLIQELRNEFQLIYPSVEKELRDISRSRGVKFAAGSALLQRAVGDLRALVINGAGLGAGEPSPVHLLNSVLLRTSLPLRKGLEPTGSPAQIENALNGLLLDEPDWHTAMHSRMSARDFEGARRIVEYLRDVQDELANELNSLWSREVASGFHSLAHDLSETRRRLEEHVSKGLVREGDRSTYDAILIGIERHLAQLRKSDGRVETGLPAEQYRFYDDHRRLGEIRDALDELKRNRTDSILSRLESSGLPPETVARIRAVLDRGDLLTAEEYIDLADLQQLPSDSDEGRDEFFEFFPSATRGLERYLEEYAPPVVVEHLRDRLVIPGLRVERLDANQARQAADLMSVWYELKRKREFPRELVIQLMTGLGFRPIEAEPSSAGHVSQVHVRAQPIADRTEIPVEFFGSRANGKYRIVGIWDRRSEEEISGIVGDSHTEAATIVLFFGRLTEQQRYSFGELCRRARKTFLVLDELLLLFLCGEPGSRLPVLFRCTLPFTHLDPYITTGSLVPPEMFFGRERERDQIIDPNGPSVLYGGRQLGKTALLRHVKRMYHNPEKGWVVRWIDLRAEGVGYHRGTEEIWPILVRELIRYEILPSRTPATTGAERIVELTREWLKVKDGRRIVLLLDEADRFLERDATDEFRQTALLKKLMDQTGRAFKVVFAGLHNVYRTFNDPNHPIGHFGNPIQIGPLIDNGEARSARALIADPFRLVGYRFESMDLISRILAETNYYPSLLQLYGAHLLKHLGERQARTGRHACPPITITHEDVEDASRGRDLRQAIHQRFALTLQLDPRYEVIAYGLAHAIVEHTLSLDHGASAEWIRSDALYWWADGFEGTSGPELRVLLDEMVGLGVLRSAGATYTFRNANVLLLMGTEEEIRTAVLRDRPAPPVYEAATFRELVRTPSVRMSPLTAQQLGVLRQSANSLTILIGSEANDLSSVPEFLTRFFGAEFIRAADGISNHRDFMRWLSELRLSQVRHGITLVLVGHEVPWTRNWLDGAGDWLSRRKSRDLTLKVVFIADPKAALRLSDVSSEDFNELNIRVLELTPWHDGAVNQWLDANNVTSSPAARHRIAEVTGNRPYLLYRYLEKFNRTFTWEQPLNELEQELTDGPFRAEVLAALGLDDATAGNARILQTMAALDEAVDVHDLRMLVESEFPEVDVDSALQWAEHLHLARRAAAGTWLLDAFVRHLLLGSPT